MDQWAGKQFDVVDFGGEVDYTGTQFFRDRPSRPPTTQPMSPPPQQQQAPQPQPQPQVPFNPSPKIIEQNERFEYALSVASNILRQRYNEFGQLGVLGWCAEFGELIDNLKELGFAGNMFVRTRSQALKTCEEILRLRLDDVKMQLIWLYLCSLIARLRRFLDGDKVWNDYPDFANFPLEPKMG